MDKKFKISAQDIGIFAEAGIPITKMLSHKFGMSAKEFIYNVKLGNIYFAFNKKSRFKRFIQWIKKNTTGISKK